MPNVFDRVLFSNTGNSFRCLMTDVTVENTKDGRADRNQLTLVTRAIHVSRIIAMWTLVNPNHVGVSDAGEGIKEPESGLMHQEAHAQRRAAILSKHKRRRRNLRRKCRYGLNLFVSVLDWIFDHSYLSKKVIFFDEAHKLWVASAQ
jgi:hypothetical protein